MSIDSSLDIQPNTFILRKQSSFLHYRHSLQNSILQSALYLLLFLDAKILDNMGCLEL